MSDADEEREIIRQAMRLLGSRKTERKAMAVRENGRKGGAHAWTEQSKQKLREAQRARRERELRAKHAEDMPCLQHTPALSDNYAGGSDANDQNPE